MPIPVKRQIETRKKSVYVYTGFIVPCVASPSKNRKAVSELTSLFPVRRRKQRPNDQEGDEREDPITLADYLFTHLSRAASFM